MLQGLDHINIATDKLEETRRFFIDVLGFHDSPRPDFGRAGAWLALDDTDIVHLMAVDAARPAEQGLLDHFALRVTDLDALKARLARFGVPYRAFALPDGTRKGVVVSDPNGVTIELTCRVA